MIKKKNDIQEVQKLPESIEYLEKVRTRNILDEERAVELINKVREALDFLNYKFYDPMEYGVKIPLKKVIDIAEEQIKYELDERMYHKLIDVIKAFVKESEKMNDMLDTAWRYMLDIIEDQDKFINDATVIIQEGEEKMKDLEIENKGLKTFVKEKDEEIEKLRDYIKGKEEQDKARSTYVRDYANYVVTRAKLYLTRMEKSLMMVQSQLEMNKEEFVEDCKSYDRQLEDKMSAKELIIPTSQVDDDISEDDVEDVIEMDEVEGQNTNIDPEDEELVKKKQEEETEEEVEEVKPKKQKRPTL